MAGIIIEKPKVRISTSILTELEEKTYEQGQVVFHILFLSVLMPTHIRIWPSTHLYDLNSSHKSDLVHSENISLYPEWSLCPQGKGHHFTLVFSGLPKSCTRFDLVEHCTNQSGAFEIRNVNRNDTDVYYYEMLS